MTKRIKSIAILLSVLLLVGIIGSIGATAAIWTTGGGAAGDSAAAPVVNSTDWNVWADYFTGAPQGTSSARLTGFKEELGFSHNRLIIPTHIDVEIEKDGTKSTENREVVEIAGGMFANSALKEMIEEIYIPYTVTKICANAFSGFINLRKIVFGAIGEDSSDNEKKVVIEMFAFSGCASFDKDTGIVYEGIEGQTQRLPEIDANAFYASGTMLQETP